MERRPVFVPKNKMAHALVPKRMPGEIIATKLVKELPAGTYVRIYKEHLGLVVGETYNGLMCIVNIQSLWNDAHTGLDCPRLGLYGWVFPTNLQPAEVLEGPRSKRNYIWRVLRHPVSGEQLIAAGCRARRSFWAMQDLIIKTEGRRTRAEQIDLYRIMEDLRARCYELGWRTY